jgi:Na+-transporting methylmalonyl-CoA/oxaloacetate decarboxylase gamma subunit
LSLLEQGLAVGAIGMGTTFAVLGLVILVMVLLRYLPRGRQAAPAQPLTGMSAEMAALPDAVEQEAVAAIAVALAHLGAAATSQSGLGSCLESGPGPWWRGGQDSPQHLPGRGTL